MKLANASSFLEAEAGRNKQMQIGSSNRKFKFRKLQNTNRNYCTQDTSTNWSGEWKMDRKIAIGQIEQVNKWNISRENQIAAA